MVFLKNKNHFFKFRLYYGIMWLGCLGAVSTPCRKGVVYVDNI